MYFSILVVFLSFGAFLPAEGCSCISYHLQTSFCAPSNVVLKVKFLGANYTSVASEYYNYTLISYTIELLQVFKADSDIQNLKYMHTSTEYSCEIYIDPSNYNKEYLVTGSYEEGRVDLMHCNYVVPWNQLSAFQIRGIQGAYADGCNCNIYSCRHGPCSEANADECKFEGGYPYPDEAPTPAPEEDKMCARDKNGKCVWQTVGQFWRNCHDL